ncbi:MAG: T9SS type A sorting domain-containing protein [Flavobacteriales bacterium]|nr:T9SS type A sorting domain-containing protein [Flavobacteriales bacterium]
MKKFLLVSLVFGVVFVALIASSSIGEPRPYHNEIDMAEWRKMMEGQLPTGFNSVFAGSGKCAGCHGHDLLENANVTSGGVDVNPTDDWRGTMMANSARDPFWRAKVAHEIALHPQHEDDIVDNCTSCHAPQGKFHSDFMGYEHYSLDTMATDSLALDGVSCGACHQQRPDGLGQLFSGKLNFSPDTIWGPYISDSLQFPIFSSAMESFVGFFPMGHEKVAQSEMCATCHTLLTETIDLDGNFTGTDFIEQATYHEWLNSAYNDIPGTAQECQGCHLPRLPDSEEIILASGYAFLPGRAPFGQHWLVGGNTFMLELLKNNIDELGLTASEQNFDTVIDRTLNQLQTQTATLEIEEGEVDGDTARYVVKLANLAGHKFPSGYPSRRAYIEFTMTDNEDNILWQSGALQPNYEVWGQDPEWEPHYDIITQEDEVQIYELVMGDVNDDVTTVLVRAHHPIKDNRLVPLGFSTEHTAYDTTMIVGSAANDPNFNVANGVEGSGSDEVRFHIPVSGVDGIVHVAARLMYQSVPPKWNNELFSVSAPEIDLFEEMYVQQGAWPVEVAQWVVSSVLTGVPAFMEEGIRLWPNPTASGKVDITSSHEKILYIKVYDARGKLVGEQRVNALKAEVLLPTQRGTYLLEIKTEKETRVEKVVSMGNKP